MPYKIRKAPGRDLYWVVGMDGKHHSKEPLPLETAKDQLTALNIAHARKMGHAIPLIKPNETISMQAKQAKRAVHEVCLPKKEFVKEHKHLISVLKHSGDAMALKEMKKQAKELKEHL